jgi:uncharacterized caspase-like protein
VLRLLVAVLALVSMSVGAADAQAGRRVALVVGVSNYQHVPKLGNPTNDALDISNAFYRLGFQVQTLIDPDRKSLEDAIRKLGRDAEGAEAGVFYYSGHALEVSGQNLLVPAPADIRSERDLRFETVDLDSVLDSVSGRGKVSLLILDSCRDNPFSKQLAGSSRAISLRGLGHVDAAVGTLIAFSTAPGKTAADGDARNSPFTTALLHNIERPGVEVRRMFGDVRREVREATGGRQIPWENSALEGEFFFKPLPPVADKPAPAPPPAVAESQFQQALRVALQKALPDLNREHAESTVKAYLEEKASKAQAFYREKNVPWRMGGRDSAYAAEQTTLESCQIRYGSPCSLLAVNDTVAEPSSDGTWVGRSMSRVNYDGLFDPIQIPALRPEWRWREDVTNYLAKGAPKAAAIHPWGRIFTSSGTADQKTAEADALKKCNDDPDRAGKDGPCFLYAIGNRVVLGLRITGPRAQAKTISEAVRLVAPVRADEAYRTARPFKALAVQPETGNWTNWDGASSASNAESMALGHCQVNANKPCVLIARGEELMTDNPVEAPRRDMEEVHMRGVFNINKMPFRPGASFDIIRGYDLLSQPKAMAVKLAPPRYISATGATLHDAEQKALSDCNAISGSRCMLYAVNDTIVLPDRKTQADP